MSKEADTHALPDGVTFRFVLVRHGEPEVSVRGRCYGKLDVGLSERGRGQVRRLPRRFMKTTLDAVYASPRRRARESAEIIALREGLRVRVEEGLSEINFGDFEGRSYEEIAELYPALYRAWMETPTEVTFPGGESFTEMRARVLSTADHIRSAHAGSVAGIFTHGGVNRIILTDALRMRPADIFRLDQTYSSVSIIDYYGDLPIVRLVNYFSEAML